MSEEPEVSPLRLKRPGASVPPLSGGNAPTPSPAVPEAPLSPTPAPLPPGPAETAHDAASGERTRRRPSLGQDPVPAPGVPHPHPEAPPPRPGAAPVSAPPPSDVAPAAPPVFKLKIGAKAPLPPVPPPATESAAGDPLKAFDEAASGAPLLPLPGMGPASMGAAPLPPLPPLAPLPAPGGIPGGVPGVPPIGEPAGARGPIHLRAEAPAEALDPAHLPPPPITARAAKAAVGRGHAKRDALLFGLVFLLVAGAGTGAYFYFSKPAAEPPPPPVNKAVAEARQKEQARVDAAVDGKDVPAERAVGNVTPGELQNRLQEKNTAVPPAPVVPAPGATTPGAAPATPLAGPADPGQSPVAPPVAAQPSPRFVRYAEGIRVSGVYQGSPARALIDGRLIRQGETVEPVLGIKFADIDAEAKQIILEDASGARVKVKYL